MAPAPAFNPTTHYSPHFSREELTATSQRGPDGKLLANTPTRAAEIDLGHLCALLEDIRALLGVPMRVTSGYRSEAVERAVQKVGPGAVLRVSQHMLGQACDFIPVGLPTWQAFEAIEASGLPFDQLIYEAVGGARWIHVSIPPGHRPPRRMAGLITDAASWIPYRPGLARSLETA